MDVWKIWTSVRESRENYGRTLTVDTYRHTAQTEHLSIPNDELKASYSKLLQLQKKSRAMNSFCLHPFGPYWGVCTSVMTFRWVYRHQHESCYDGRQQTIHLPISRVWWFTQREFELLLVDSGDAYS